VDFFHMSIEEPDIAASIESAAGFVRHVQVGDSNRQLPGYGHTDFTSGFAALRRIGYDGYLALECRIPDDPEQELPACVRYLSQCLEDSLQHLER
jgi:sugar phosphate isomerase/epimerase